MEVANLVNVDVLNIRESRECLVVTRFVRPDVDVELGVQRSNRSSQLHPAFVDILREWEMYVDIA